MIIVLAVQLPVDVDAEGGLAPPEFGFSSGPAGGGQQDLLSWQAMRQVGAGFWLTDSQVGPYPNTVLSAHACFTT